MASSQTWPPASGLTTVVVPRPAILCISAFTAISAPASIVFSTLRAVSGYGNWNNFCPAVHIHSQPADVPDGERDLLHVGTSFTLDVIMDAKHPNSVTPTQCRVTDISTPSHLSTYVSAHVLETDGSFEPDQSKVYRISWKTEGAFVARGLVSERVSEVLDLGDGRAVYRTWECQGGVLARVVKWKYEKVLQDKFALWCKNLKSVCERVRASEGGGNDDGGKASLNEAEYLHLLLPDEH